MFSTAVAGSVSDATKATPSFSVSSVKLTPMDASGVTVTPGVMTLTAGQTSTNIPLSATQAIGPGALQFGITVAIGNSGGGGRPTNNSQVLLAIGSLNRTKLSTEFNKQITQTNFDPGDPATQIGMFVPPGPDGSGGDDTTNCKIADTVAAAGTTATINGEGVNIFENPEVENGNIPSARAEYQIVNNSIEILDLVTGVYAVGPSDTMAFSVKIIQ